MPTYETDSNQTPGEHWMECRNCGAAATFGGSETYEWFRNRGSLIVGATCVRLCCSSGGSDQIYIVSENYNLEGVSLPTHSGREGIFTPTELLDNDIIPDWSIEMLDIKKLE